MRKSRYVEQAGSSARDKGDLIPSLACSDMPLRRASRAPHRIHEREFVFTSDYAQLLE